MNNKAQSPKIVVLLGLLVLAYFIFGFKTASIVIQGVEPVDVNDVWGNIPINIKAPYLGDITNGPGKLFCNSNDGEIGLANNYVISNNLELSSALVHQTENSRPCSGNYLYAELDLPAGTLSGDYEFKNSAGRTGGGEEGKSTGNVEIVGFASFSSESCTPNACNFGPNTDFKTGEFSYRIDSPKKVLVKIENSKSYDGSTSVKVRLTFTPLVASSSSVASSLEPTKEDALDDLQCTANMDCTSVCGTKVPTCEKSLCYCANVQTSNPTFQPTWFDKVIAFFSRLFGGLF